ncbi:MAG: tetratricopeptide repeat protein [Desulfobacterales bacterium]|nr:tetratricopeptide repeat protein [Desulfobacterales bacterium]
MICTWFQVEHWQNGITIFKHTLNVTKDNCVANCELGHALMRNGKLDDAVVQFYKALKINPNYEEAHANLGCTLARQGKISDASYHYNKALLINPNNAKAHNNLGVLLAGKEKVNDAIYHYKEALRINPKYGGAYYNLGKIYANKGDIENAILFYKKTLQISPNMAEALYNLSWIYATHKDNKFINGKEAVKLAEKLCRLQNYSHPLSLDALAAAYAEAGKFDKAVKAAQQGLNMSLTQCPKELARGLTKRLQLYQAGIPYRQK